MSSKLPTKVTNEVGSGVSELYQRFQCDYCQTDIPGLRIRCADCSDFDLCLECFSCGAQIGKHKNTHKYIFMNNGGFSIFPTATHDDDDEATPGRRRKSITSAMASYQSQLTGDLDGSEWNAREEMRLLDAVEQYGYGNWKDIAQHVDTKTPDQNKEEYIKHYIHGLIGKHTWQEELRGYAIDHTQAADRGPLSPTLTGKLPPINVSNQEALLLGYMPHRDDYEDFDKDTERLVAQIADKSVEDEDLDVALKLAQCDIYERKLREQVRRKRVARDYQLVSKFYKENPIVQIGPGGSKLSPLKISNQVKAVKKGEGPKQELIEALKPFTQFNTSQEFDQLVNNICAEKDLKVRVKELKKYRENGLMKVSELVPFECLRYKRQLKLKRLAKQKANVPTLSLNKFLPSYGDYSLKSIINPHAEEKDVTGNFPFRLKKKPKKSKWSRKKEKTGRRLLIQQGCILTLASPARRESTDSTS